MAFRAPLRLGPLDALNDLRQIAALVNEVDHDNSTIVSLIEYEVRALPVVMKSSGSSASFWEEEVTGASMWRTALRKRLASLYEGITIIRSLAFAKTSDGPFEYRNQGLDRARR